MSEIDKDTVARIARLARLSVPQDQLEPLAHQMTDILDWADQLAEVDVTDIPPMTSPVDTRLAWRADRVTDGNRREDILENAPRTEFGFFAVPKVIE